MEKAKMKTKTKVPGVTLGGENCGTSLAGYLSASYKDLVKLLGRPNCEGDGYKVSTEWVLTFRGETFTLYDYKETRTYDRDLPSVQAFRRLPMFDWHIGANSKNVSAFRDAIGAALDALDSDGQQSIH
jgi:hypothetical protein